MILRSYASDSAEGGHSYRNLILLLFILVFTGGAGAIASGVSAIAAAGIGATPLIRGEAASGFIASLATGGFYRYVKEKSNEELLPAYSNFSLSLEAYKREFAAAQERLKALSTSIYKQRKNEATR